MANFDVPLSAIAAQSPAGQRINGYEHVELAFTRPDFSDVPSHGLQANHCRATDVKEAPLSVMQSITCRATDGIGFEFPLCGRVAVHVGQPGYAVPL